MNPNAAVINECSKPPEVEVTLEELARAMQRADAEQQRLGKIALGAMRASDGAELVMSRVSEKYAELCNGVLLLDGKAICPRRHFSSNHNRMADVVSGDTKVKIPKSIAEESGILTARAKSQFKVGDQVQMKSTSSLHLPCGEIVSVSTPLPLVKFDTGETMAVHPEHMELRAEPN